MRRQLATAVGFTLLPGFEERDRRTIRDRTLCNVSCLEVALEQVSVTVAVSEQLEFWYPLQPMAPIEAGRKLVSFHPPEERLHHWVGANVMGGWHGSDLYRLRRQQTLLRALLESWFDFRRPLADPSLLRCIGKDPLPLLSRIGTSWGMATFDAVQDAFIGGKAAPRPPRRQVFSRLRSLLNPRGSAR